MPYNGSGTFLRTQNWAADAAAGIKIVTTRHDSEDDNFAAGLSQVITRDGQSPATANLPMGGFRHTGAQNPVNPQDYATKAYSDLRVLKAGDTMTGQLNIQPGAAVDAVLNLKGNAAATWLYLDATTGKQNGIRAKIGGVDRWLEYLGDGTAEGGANAGSNFAIYRCTDAGAAVDVALGINRASGQVSMLHGLTMNDSLVLTGGANVLVPAGGDYYKNGVINWVRQGHLVTTTGTQNTTAVYLATVLPGGTWGFSPTAYGNSTVIHLASFMGTNDAVSTYAPRNSNFTSAGGAYFSLGQGPTAGASTAYVDQRYMQASPPYDMGDGEVPLFTYALIDNGSGDIIATWTAPDPPWAYNGPTNITADQYREDGTGFRRMKNVDLAGLSKREAVIALAEAPIEEVDITMAMKNADMEVFPNPWVSDQTVIDGTATPVLLDPVSPLAWQLAEYHRAGHSVLDLIHKDGKPADLLLGNTGLKRFGPRGLMIVEAKWR